MGNKNSIQNLAQYNMHKNTGVFNMTFCTNFADDQPDE